MRIRMALLTVLVFLFSLSSAVQAAVSFEEARHILARLNEAGGTSYRLVLWTEEPSANAAALADGRIYISPSLLGLLDEDETAFVLGHEIAHITGGHHAKQANNALGNLLIAAVIAKAAGAKGEDLKRYAALGAALLQAAPSRKDERGADQAGLELAVKAGYSPEGGVRAMEVLGAQSGDTANIPVVGWFADHPSTAERKTALADEARRLAQEAATRAAGHTITLEISAAGDASGTLTEKARLCLSDYLKSQGWQVVDGSGGQYRARVQVSGAYRSGKTLQGSPALIQEADVHLILEILSVEGRRLDIQQADGHFGEMGSRSASDVLPALYLRALKDAKGKLEPFAPPPSKGTSLPEVSHG